MQAFYHDVENIGSGKDINSPLGQKVFMTRKMIAEFLAVESANHIFFSSGATEGLNLVIKGILEANDSVVTTAIEHNSVIRVLDFLSKERNINYDIAECDRFGQINIVELERLIKRSRPKLVIINYVSNVTGMIQDVGLIQQICHDVGALLLIDASQAIGHFPVLNTQVKADFIVFSGHKGLKGPTGVGVVYMKQPDIVDALIHGGTSNFLSQNINHPNVPPYKFEAGTMDALAIISLGEIIKDIKFDKKIDDLHLKVKYMLEKLSEMENIILYTKVRAAETRDVGIISFNIKNYNPSRIGFLLETHYNIKISVGLHCAPLIHQFLGTDVIGTCRVSISDFSTMIEINAFIQAIGEISAVTIKNNIYKSIDGEDINYEKTTA